MNMKRRRKHLSYCYVPSDVCVEILARLPAKSVLRFRSVCKTWESLIDTPGFESMHLTHCKNNREKPKILLLQEPSYRGGRGQWTLRCAETFRKTRDFNMEFTSWLAVCYLDGLLLLCDLYSDSLVLLNLSIRKYIALPSSPMFYEGYQDLGIGYDSASNDYKVVAWSSASSGEVYSLNSGIWKSKIAIEHAQHSEFRYPQVLFKGIIHWIARHLDNKDHLILTFDVHDEVTEYMMLPHCGGRETRVLIVVDESLAILDYNWKQGCIWVMEEYGIIDSWTKQYMINLHSFKFLYLKENGEMLLAKKWGGVKSYNIRTGVVKHLAKTYPKHVNDANNYMESLVLFRKVDGQSLKYSGQTKST